MNKDPKVETHHHHILSDKAALSVGGALLFLTVVTVAVAHVDLGALNFVVAMFVATVKALLVALFFMNLLYDRRENAVIFGTSFLFLAIFIVLTGTDLFFRGDVYVKAGQPLTPVVQAKSTLKNPWMATTELVQKGAELYAQQCVSCHGAAGKGDGPAAGALNPPPRNFTQTAGWKNGRKPSQIFKTLKEGIPGSAMASYGTLPADDRWALVHYVASFGPKPEADTSADLAKIGIDPTKEGGGAQAEAPTIPVELAMRRMAQPESTLKGMNHGVEGQKAPMDASVGAKIYASRCADCHGAKGEGGISVKNLGESPRAYLTTAPFGAQTESLRSSDAFRRIVVQGLPGDAMPGNGQLSATEISELFSYVKSLAGSR